MHLIIIACALVACMVSVSSIHLVQFHHSYSQMTSSQTTAEIGQEQGNLPADSLPKHANFPSEKKDELATVIQQLEEVIRIKELCIDRLTKELSDAKNQSALLEGQSAQSLDLKEDRIEELEEALRESVRITADREVALDAETQHRNILDQKVSLSLTRFRN